MIKYYLSRYTGIRAAADKEVPGAQRFISEHNVENVRCGSHKSKEEIKSRDPKKCLSGSSRNDHGRVSLCVGSNDSLHGSLL
jgi:hypothetical protein